MSAVANRTAAAFCAAAVLVLLAAGPLADRLWAAAWAALVRYAPPVRADLAPVAPGPALAPGVLMVVVDGLTPEAARGVPALEQLRARGQGYRAAIPPPAWPRAAWATLFTGAPPEIHAQLAAIDPRPLETDSLVRRAVAAGRPVWLAGPADWIGLLGPPAEEARRDGEPAAAVRAAARAAAAPAPRDPAGTGTAGQDPETLGPPLAVVYVAAGVPGGDSGGGWRPATLDAALRPLLDAASGLTVAVVGAPLPRPPSGGEAGALGPGGLPAAVGGVALVLAGPGVRPAGDTGWAAARLEDVAPTLAALLGLAPPVHATGVPLADGLALEPAARQALWERTATAHLALTQRYAGRLGASPLVVAAASDASRIIASLAAQRAEARRAALAAGRARRFWPAAAATAALVGLLAFAARGLPGRAAALGVLGYAALLGGTTLWAYGGPPSLAAMDPGAGLPAFLHARHWEAVAAVGVAALLAGVVAGPGSGGPASGGFPGAGSEARAAWWVGAAAGCLTTVAIAAGLGLVLVRHYVAYGPWYAGVLPPERALALHLWALVQLRAVAAMAWAVPLAGLAGVAIGRKRVGRGRPG